MKPSRRLRHVISGLGLVAALVGSAHAHDLVFEANTGGQDVEITNLARPGGVFAAPSQANPIILGKNLYAPDLVRNGDRWNVYYGGWKSSPDVNDRIYFAVSDDLLPDGAWSGQHVIIDNGEFVHVNDPSVQRRSATDWVMAYTVARDGRDWIAISTSSDGATWTPNRGTAATQISIAGRTFYTIARPSLVWTGSRWRLYFDGKTSATAPLRSYVAESTATGVPRRFRYLGAFADVAGFPGFFEPDVEYFNGRYTAVVQRHFNELVLLVSTDGLRFRARGTVLRSNNPAFTRRTVSNPGLLYDSTARQVRGYSFGMTDSPELVGHDIGFAYPQLQPTVLGCPSTLHVFGHATRFDRTRTLTFGGTTFCRIRIENGAGRVIHEQTVNARSGDVWRFVPSGSTGLEIDDADGEDLDFEDDGDEPVDDLDGGCSTTAGSGSLLLGLFGLLLVVRRRARRPGAGTRRYRRA